MFREVGSYRTWAPASTVAVSDTGLTAVGWNTSVTIWKDLFSKHSDTQDKAQSPYMTWGGEGKRIERVRWCPFEDVLGIGHDAGFSSILVPGAGEANYDALEVNPHETAKQRRDTEVRSLLDKLQPDMIALDPNFVANLDLRSEKQRRAERDLDGQAPTARPETDTRNRARGRNSALKRFLRKQRDRNIIDEKRLLADEIRKERQAKNQAKQKAEAVELGPALGRFVRKE
jgi:U3 small nucleolar RNA-associated protein 7